MILNPKYWGKTAAGILPVCSRTGRVLLILRSQQVMDPGVWGIPGGRIMDGSIRQDRYGRHVPEPIETPVQGAVREFREETGYNGRVDLVDLYVFRDKTHGFAYYNFLGLVRKEFSEAKVEENWEVEVAMWMTIEEALAIEPKHFGLMALFNDKKSLEKILVYTGTPKPSRRKNPDFFAARHEMSKQLQHGIAGTIPDDVMRRVKLYKYGKALDYTIWVVDGSVLRFLGEIEFNIGGNHWVYPYIPEDEVWIEETSSGFDMTANAVHEVIEAELMMQGYDYDTAHAMASSREKSIRKALLKNPR